MLKALLLRRRIDLKKKELEEIRTKMDGFAQREADLTKAIEEVETEEQRTAMDEEIAKFDEERTQTEQAGDTLEREISELETELQAEEAAQNTDAPEGGSEKTPESAPQDAAPQERGGMNMNRIRSFAQMDAQTRDAFFAREDAKTYLAEVRAAIKEKRAITGAGLTIPDVMLGLIRETVAERSKLLPYVNLRHIGGTSRQNILGTIPEAVWTEMCAKINELDIGFNQIEADGYKVGAYIPICNATLEDSDVNLADEIVHAIGCAIAKALDKAILFGTGTKMPIGIVTRLAQTQEPANWGANAPTWTDLHATNILKISIADKSGAEFFSALVQALGVAKPRYSSDGLFWVMNRKTHISIMAKALAFNSAAALVSNTTMMPVLGGTVIEMDDDDIADNEIIGGFGGNYLLVERAGLQFASSDIPLFLEDQTVFKGTARYDGKPVAGEGFVVVNFANSTPTQTSSFAKDWANEEMNALGITAKASASNVGKTVLTVADTLAESPELYYKVGKVAFNVGDDQPASGFSSLTSDTTEITAAAGKIITVIEVDSDDKVVSVGYVASVPKAS